MTTRSICPVNYKSNIRQVMEKPQKHNRVLYNIYNDSLTNNIEIVLHR